MSEISVILVDDHEMVRQGLAQVLKDESGLTVIGHASSGLEAIRMTEERQPDVLVLDYGLPDADGAAVTMRLRREGCPTRIVILTVHDNVHYVLRAREAGAEGFVVKSDAVDELVRAIVTVHAGGTFVSPRLAKKFEEHLRGPKGQHVGLNKLSQREFELLRLLGGGLSLQECAVRMSISESTASTYRARLMTKLELTNTAQIIRFAIENGLVG
jgi:DNA-binding NarL/FixJ family response regulator